MNKQTLEQILERRDKEKKIQYKKYYAINKERIKKYNRNYYRDHIKQQENIKNHIKDKREANRFINIIR